MAYLMDTSDVILSTIKATIKEMGLPVKTDGECRSIIGIRTDEAGKYLYPDLDISNKKFAQVFRSNYNRLKSGVKESLFPDVLATLKRIRSVNDGMAIASSRRTDSLCNYLEDLGIIDWFKMIVGADSVKNGKPDPNLY